MKLILLTTLVLVAIFGVPTEQTHLIAALKNGEKVPVDLTVHHDYALLVSGEPLVPQPFFRPSINLYDMEKHLEARKVVGDRICYVRKFSGPGEPKDLHHKMKEMQSSKETHDVSEDWNIPGAEIKEADREKVLGKRVNDFCAGYQVFWLQDGKQVTRRQVIVERKRQLTGNVNWDKQTGLSGSLGAQHKWDNGFSANGGISYNNQAGLTPNLGLGYENNGFKVNGGVSHNKHTGFSSNLNAGYTWKNGASLTGGLTHGQGGFGASVGFSIPLGRR